MLNEHFLPKISLCSPESRWVIFGLRRANVGLIVRAISFQNFYARQHICYSAYIPWQFRLSVCPSVTRVDQSKTIEARIMQFSPYSSPIPLVFQSRFHPEILMGSPREGASNKGGVSKISHFLPLSVNISKTVPDTAKVTINH